MRENDNELRVNKRINDDRVYWNGGIYYDRSDDRLRQKAQKITAGKEIKQYMKWITKRINLIIKYIEIPSCHDCIYNNGHCFDYQEIDDDLFCKVLLFKDLHVDLINYKHGVDVSK